MLICYLFKNIVNNCVLFLSENFAKAEYYRQALEQLNNNSTAMASLGAPPLKIHNIHLSDRHNRMDHSSAQVSSSISTGEILTLYINHCMNPFQLKIPVTGSKTGGYLYTTSTRDTLMNRYHVFKNPRIETFLWNLHSLTVSSWVCVC